MEVNDFFKTALGRFVLYTLLCVCIFVALTLLMCFIVGNTDIFEWRKSYRAVIVIAGTVFMIFALAFTKVE